MTFNADWGQGGACSTSVWADPGGPAHESNDAFSASSPTGNGSVAVYRFAQGVTPTCADVRTMLP